MANQKFESGHNNEKMAMNTGDQGVSKINFSEIMQPDSLHDAVRQSDAAVAQATLRLASIQDRIKQHFGDDQDGHNKFMEVHNQYYATA